MTDWLRGRRGGIVTFVIIAALVAGGLGWASLAALRLEREQQEQQAALERADRLRLALWRLDNRMTAILAREEARPFSHFSAVFAPPVALDSNGQPVPPGAVVELSPLLSAELPAWMLLHFQSDGTTWESPQVLSSSLQTRLRAQMRGSSNVTPARKTLLDALTGQLPAERLLALTRQFAGQTTIRERAIARLSRQELEADNGMQQAVVQGQREYGYRAGVSSKLVNPQHAEQRVSKDVAVLNFLHNGEQWLEDVNTPTRLQLNYSLNTTNTVRNTARFLNSAEVAVSMSSMVGLWLPTSAEPRLMAVRLVKVEEKDICQGIVLDRDNLTSLLAEEVQDLFPGSRVLPAREMNPDLLDRTMTTLPLRLDPGPEEPLVPSAWTPLRVGLSLAWAAAAVAMVAVGLGGWSLLSLSERRIRFVSAVTHELRTPLTTLRLYLDLMLGGMVRDESTKQEYLETMHAETDRLTRLVGNVLDFSRLENQAPSLTRTRVQVADVLARAGETWRNRCGCAGKELLVEDAAGESAIETDADLLQQVLANLLDNACKYSREAEDKRIWLRASREGGRVAFEVEDRGPGVPASEQRRIFRAFRRGKSADATTGGVGLGLALARWWTQLLGGRLRLHSPAAGGACFRVEIAAV